MPIVLAEPVRSMRPMMMYTKVMLTGFSLGSCALNSLSSEDLISESMSCFLSFSINNNYQMTQRNEETLSAGWHPDRKSSEDSFLDIMGPSQIALTETRSPKRKDKTKASLFSSKRAGDYKVTYENEMEINSERAGSCHKLAVKPINSFET